MLSISFILIRLISTSGIPSTTINGSELLMEPKPRTFSEAPSPPANRLFGSLPIPAPNPRDWKIRLWWNGWQSFHRLYCCNRTGQVYFLLSSITHYNDLIQCLRVFREGYYYIGSTFQGYFLSNVSDERYYKSCIRWGFNVKMSVDVCDCAAGAVFYFILAPITASPVLSFTVPVILAFCAVTLPIPIKSNRNTKMFYIRLNFEWIN